MTTSGNVNFVQTRNQIIRAALQKCRVAADGEEISAEMLESAQNSLNSIIKNLSTRGFHLWKLAEGTIFTQKGRAKYLVGKDSHLATDELHENRLKFAAYEGNKEFYLLWGDFPQIGDHIGICINYCCVFWASVMEVNGDKVIVDKPLPECVCSGAVVYYFRNQISRPLKILSMRRSDCCGYEMPLNQLERKTYFELPNKCSEGTPLQFYYDPKLGNGELYLWPAPDCDGLRLDFTYEQEFDIFESSKNTADFPQEWIEPLKWLLAYDLSYNYGLSESERQLLKAQADEKLLQAEQFDGEVGSIYVQPYGGDY